MLATVVLWVATAYLIREGKNKFYSLLTAVPGTFMTAVCITYILSAPEGFSLRTSITYPIGILIAAASFIWYFIVLGRKRESLL